jgi:hypothetical protein
MITIDFSPGSHGHFLSYIINQYIFDIKVDSFNIFQTSGAAHLINLNTEFLDKRIVLHGHYSYFDFDYPDHTDQIIWIAPDPELDFVLLTNIYNRCPPRDALTSTDVNIDDIKKLHIDMLNKNSNLCQLRNNWYNKLLENHLSQSIVLKKSNIPAFEFQYRSFFDTQDFVKELSRCADFCNMKLYFKSDLIDIHKEFLNRNQGYQKWNLAKTLIDQILTGQQTPIDPEDWQLQAFINFNLSKMFKIYSGQLFDHNEYAQDTRQIFQIVTNFLEEYDQRF